jgi:hypothetical protein
VHTIVSHVADGSLANGLQRARPHRELRLTSCFEERLKYLARAIEKSYSDKPMLSNKAEEPSTMKSELMIEHLLDPSLKQTLNSYRRID